MSRDANQALAHQDETRKNLYTGMVQGQMNNIPNDYNPEQKAAITQAEMGGIDAGYGNVRDEMMRRASATGSSAGVPETLLESNREAIQQKAQAGAQLQETFANVPVQRALQKASIFQPALGGMLSSNYPQQAPSQTGAVVGGVGTAAAGIALAL